jgi:hypothetical protein
VSAPVAVVCLACRLDLGDLDADVACLAAAVHDELRHEGRPVAFVADVDDPRRDVARQRGRDVA